MRLTPPTAEQFHSSLSDLFSRGETPQLPPICKFGWSLPVQEQHSLQFPQAEPSFIPALRI